MKTHPIGVADSCTDATGTAVILESAPNIPSAIYIAMKEVLARGYAIRTQYDRKDSRENYIDPPSLDVSSAIEILDPYAQPRFPKSRCVEMGKYIAETCWGVKHHLVLDQEELKGKLAKGEFDEKSETHWPYTYHQSLYAYPASNGRRINQVQRMPERLAEDPITRRATAITFVPEIDQYMKGDLPCLQRIFLRCTEDKRGRLYLHMDTHWRSRDLFNAAADNIIAMTFWQREWAEELSRMMDREVLVGKYKDFAVSLHNYGQVLKSMGVEKIVTKWNTIPQEGMGYTSEDARDLLVVPDLKKLPTKDSGWLFPQEARDRIVAELERMKRGEYLP